MLRSHPVMSCPRLPVSAASACDLFAETAWPIAPDLMLEALVRFRLPPAGRRSGASIDGVGTDMKVQVRQFPATFDFGRIPLSGTPSVPEDRRGAG